MVFDFPVYVVRHGETDWNRQMRFQGQVDIPLNSLGERQASSNGRLLAGLISAPERFRFVASPLGRTRRTMELVREAMGLEPDTYETDERLVEVSFGDWERHTLDELKRAFPEIVARRERAKWEFTPPNGESYADLTRRVAGFMEELSGPTVIVAHGGVIRSFRHIVEKGIGPDIVSEPVPQDQVLELTGGRTLWHAA